MRRAFVTSAFVLGSLCAACAQTAEIHTFKRVALSDKFFCEGAGFGDFNNDKKMDVVSGPYVYYGPDFQKRVEYYEAKPFDKHGYSKNFFAFTHDFNRDKWTDILILGFPGEDASWFENPKGQSGPWTRHKVFDVVDNESPTFTDVNGDAQPDLVCSTGGQLGWASFDPKDAAKPWTFHAISPKSDAYQKFTHGLGVGDVNGDGRMDLLEAGGWWEQPADLSKDDLWTKHAVGFGSGGAQMHAVDIDGDGDNDVVTSLAAHQWGLAWFEQVKENGAIAFHKHLIIGEKAEDSPHGVKFSQMHAVAVLDMDGDGAPDIVTGKRHWAHGDHGDPEPNAPAVLYWFKTVRSSQGVSFIPYQIDDNSGVGTQVTAGDITGDKRPDIIVGNKLGTFVFLHGARKVGQAEWEKAQPKLR